jgi:molecular chaperone DnaJ
MFSQMQDLFSEMFSGGGNPFGSRRGSGGARRGGDLRVQARLSFREAALGCKKDISVATPVACDECSGSGAKKGTSPETCPTCRGAGQVSTARGFVMFTSTCQRCGGQGSILKDLCAKCDGRGLAAEKRTVVVSFPAGIDNGQRLRVSGKGMPGVNGPAGDLYVDVAVDEDPRFERDGADLVTRTHVSMRQAALGETIEVPCIAQDESATVKVSVPAGTQPGTVFTLKGQGLPRLDGRGRGALIVVVQVDVPTRVSPRARELLEELDRELGTKDSGVAAP